MAGRSSRVGGRPGTRQGRPGGSSPVRRRAVDAGQARGWLAVVMSLGGLAMLLGAVCAGASGRSPDASPRGPSPRASQAAPTGPARPWGRLEYTRIDLQPPSTLLAAFQVERDEQIPVSPDLIAGLGASGLAPETITAFQRRLSRRGVWSMLSDVRSLTVAVGDDRERQRLAAVITTVESYVVRVGLDGATDVDTLVRYWTRGAADGGQDVRPLLESLARVPGGATVDLLRLLPVFARNHANRYPHPEDPVESRADCFWTAFNFFAVQPDDVVDDPMAVFDTLRTGFRPVSGPPALGDLIVLLDQRGSPVHAAVYIAEDLVFTKNGRGVLRPWTYMKTQAMVDLYTALDGPLRVVAVGEIAAQATRPAAPALASSAR